MVLSLFILFPILAILSSIINAATIQIPLPDPPIPRGLPPCSSIDRPCTCPSGSTFHNITTVAILGASAWDVRGVIGSFFGTEWFGSSTDETEGTDNTIGAVRRFWYDEDHGFGFGLEEQLTGYKAYPDGSFVQSHAQYGDQKPPYVVKPPSMGGGGFRGFYGTINAQQTVIANETAIVYNQYRCDIGNPYDTALNNEGSLRNASWILWNLGKLSGVDVAPYSIHYA